MFSNIKAKLRKLADITAGDFLNLLQWGDSEVDPNPNTIVCSASVNGEPVVYMTAEPVFVLGQYAFRPKTTESQIGEAGDAIDAALVHEMKTRGIGKALIVLPPGVPLQPDERILRVVERRIPAQQYEQSFVPDLKVAESPSVWLN